MPTIQHRRGTASALASVNETPAAGVLVWESDTNRIKFGDGASSYSTLAYVGTGSTTFTGAVTLPNGSVESPSLLLSTTDTDTGLFWAQENTVAITCGGIERFRISGVAMVVNSNAMLFGATASRSAGPTDHPRIQLEGLTAGDCSVQCIAGSTTATVSPQILLARHRGSVGGSTVVASGDSLGLIKFNGGDGTDCVSTGAAIEARVDGTPDSNDMPGRLMFLTTADGSDAPAERMRIDSSGNVGIGTTAPSAMLDVNSSKVRVRSSHTPASASATGNAGDICWDSSYVYICTATNTWRRIAHSTW